MIPFDEAMYEVLARPKYDILTGRAVDYQQIIMEALGRAIIGLLDRVQLNVPDPGAYDLRAMTYVFVIVAAILLLGVAMGLTYIILKRRARRARQNSDISAIFEDIANKQYTLPQLLKKSREFADANQLREAVRCYYIAVLVSLENKRTIKVDKSKTNAQLIEEIAQKAPALSSYFALVVDLFQQSWFGFKPVDEDGYRKFTANAEEILK